MPKIVYYTASDPEAQNECYAHLALILYDAGAPMPFRITARTKDLVRDAAEKIIAEELERTAKSPRNPANQQVKVEPRKRREETPPPPIFPAAPKFVVTRDEIAAPPMPEFEEEF